MSVLAAASATSLSIWLILLWFVIVPVFAIVPVVYALAQVAGERKENLAYARGERPADDPDTVVVER